MNLDSWRYFRRIGQGAGSSERKAGARSRCALGAKFKILRIYHQGSGEEFMDLWQGSVRSQFMVLEDHL